MPGSQGATGDRNEVWNLERLQSPKSLGGRGVVNDPHAQGSGGRDWGTPRCFGTPLAGATCPSPAAAREHCSTATLGRERRWARLRTCRRPRAPGPPPGTGPGLRLRRREGRSGLTGAAAPPPPPPQPRTPAAAPARLRPLPPAQVRGSAPGPRLSPCEPAARSRGQAAGERKEGASPGPRRPPPPRGAQP